jgi:hypothetical protein
MTAQRGIFGFGGQTAKEAVATTWYRHKAVDVDLAPLDDVRLGRPEVGGGLFPTFPYKAGVVVAGGATLQPRLENTLGWVGFGALGAVSTITGDGVGENPPVGVNRHQFKPASDQSFLPWMSARVVVPGDVAANDYGLIYKDMKALGLTLALSADAPITARLDFLGRLFEYADPSGWSWDNTFETYESIPVGAAVGGFMKIPGYSASELSIVGATVAIQNAPLDLRQEKVYGDPYIEDVTLVGRAVTVDVMVKWKDADLARALHAGSITGTEWSSTPYVQDLDVLAVSPGNISGQSVPYKCRVEMPSVLWQLNGPIRLAGNQAVFARISGTSLEPSSGDAITLSVDNEETGYTWPS